MQANTCKLLWQANPCNPSDTKLPMIKQVILARLPHLPNPSFYSKLSLYFFIKAHYLEYLENSRIVVEGSIKNIKLGLA